MKFTTVENAMVYISAYNCMSSTCFLLKYLSHASQPLGSSGYYDGLGFLYLAHFCIYLTARVANYFCLEYIILHCYRSR
jgi:hypothetical protein